MTQCKKHGPVLEVQLSGELDHHSAAVIKAELDKALSDPGVSVLEMDFKKLRFMDSSGIGILIGRYKTMQKRGGVMRVKNVNMQIGKIMELSGLYKIIEQA